MLARNGGSVKVTPGGKVVGAVGVKGAVGRVGPTGAVVTNKEGVRNGTPEAKVGAIAGTAEATVGKIAGPVELNVGVIAGTAEDNVGKIAGPVELKVGMIAGPVELNVGMIAGPAEDKVGVIIGETAGMKDWPATVRARAKRVTTRNILSCYGWPEDMRSMLFLSMLTSNLTLTTTTSYLSYDCTSNPQTIFLRFSPR